MLSQEKNGGKLMFKKISKMALTMVMKKIVIFGMVMYALCGCANAPNAKNENGISYAVNESDERIKNIIENELVKDNIYIEKSQEDDRYVCRIGDSDNAVNIDAIVSGLNVETISIEKAEPYPNAVNRDSVVDIFFGGEENVGEENVVESNQKDENNIVQEDNGEVVNIKQINTTGQMNLDSVDGKTHFVQNSHAGFYYSNDKLIVEYKQIETRGSYFEEQDKDISESYTMDMAKQELAEIFLKIMNTDVQFISCTSIYNEMGSGYYEFVFAPVVDELPLAVNDREINNDNIVDVYGRVQIGSEGIALIEANNFLWKSDSVSSDSEKSCISIEIALEILDEYITKNEIKCPKDITFTRVSMVWLPITEDWNSVQLIPVWRFYITCSELMDISLTENAATDICINAINGGIERIW